MNNENDAWEIIRDGCEIIEASKVRSSVECWFRVRDGISYLALVLVKSGLDLVTVSDSMIQGS